MVRQTLNRTLRSDVYGPSLEGGILVCPDRLIDAECMEEGLTTSGLFLSTEVSFTLLVGYHIISRV